MAHPRSLTEDYVFRVYESSSSQHLYPMETALCPVVMMVSHEGFHWNEELFISPYRRGPSSRLSTLKSSDRIKREDRVASTTSCIHHSSSPSQSNDDDVIDIQLTESECNVLP